MENHENRDFKTKEENVLLVDNDEKNIMSKSATNEEFTNSNIITAEKADLPEMINNIINANVVKENENKENQNNKDKFNNHKIAVEENKRNYRKESMVFVDNLIENTLKKVKFEEPPDTTNINDFTFKQKSNNLNELIIYKNNNNFNKELEISNETINQLESKLKEKEEEIILLKGKIEKLSSQNINNESELMNSFNKYEELNSKHIRLEEEHHSCLSENEDYKKKISKLKNFIESFQVDFNEAFKKIEIKDKEIASLTLKNLQLQEDKVKLRNLNEELEKESLNQIEETNKVSEKLKAVEHDIEELNKIILMQESRISENEQITEQIKVIKNQIEIKNSEITVLENNCMLLVKNLEKEKKLASKYKNQLSSNDNNKLVEKHVEITRLKDFSKSLKNELTNKDNLITNLRIKNSSLREENIHLNSIINSFRTKEIELNAINEKSKVLRLSKNANYYSSNNMSYYNNANNVNNMPSVRFSENISNRNSENYKEDDYVLRNTSKKKNSNYSNNNNLNSINLKNSQFNNNNNSNNINHMNSTNSANNLNNLGFNDINFKTKANDDILYGNEDNLKDIKNLMNSILES